MGKIPIQFPGLNTPVFRGKELIQQQKLLVNLERKQKLMELPQSQTRPMQIKLSPLEYGWRSFTVAEALNQILLEKIHLKVLKPGFWKTK
ncbi:hypothetical protein EAG_15902 [Camponotus floridanus]|uniref:Small ribosomal subunit protein uS5m N-terminal domain-containing protein n=1 Tax=Camponotus floridanus TaxID=104421 RepID=E2AU12_CAMFO|nr:hypothetical protein EAG_15902 [Camponotus floridanus]